MFLVTCTCLHFYCYNYGPCKQSNYNSKPLKQFSHFNVIFLPCFIGVNLKSGHNFLSLALLAVFLYCPSALLVSCYNEDALISHLEELFCVNLIGVSDIFLKLVSTILYFFMFHMIALQNYEKCFLLHLKSYFLSQDIQIFVFLSSHLFFPVGHCF